MKKRWITFVAVLMVATLSTIAATGGLTGTQDSNTAPLDKLSSRVAAILGLEEQVVADAIKQARDELRDEAIRGKLAGLVEKGLLTQEQADEKLGEIKTKLGDEFLWINKKPFLKKMLTREDIEARLSAMVEKGLLTQEQADKKLGEIDSKSGDDYLWKDKEPFLKTNLTYEKFEAKLSALVEKGELTQGEADEKLEGYSGK
jgi:polyhydroxyalkanoate synthesis regulator phasin